MLAMGFLVKKCQTGDENGKERSGQVWNGKSRVFVNECLCLCFERFRRKYPCLNENILGRAWKYTMYSKCVMCCMCVDFQ